MLPRVSFLACIVLAAAASAGVAAPVLETAPALRYKFKAGDKMGYNLVQKMKMTMTINGMEVKMEMNMTMDMANKVASVDREGNGHLKQSFERIRLTVDGPTGKEEIDSKGGKGGDGLMGKLMQPFFKALIDTPFDVVMTPTGVVKSVKVPESVLKTAKAAPGVGETFSEDGLKQLFGQSGFVLPEGTPVKGKTWQQKNEMKALGGTMVVTTTQAYLGQVKRGGKTLAAFSLAPVSKFENKADAAAPIKITKQESKGTAYFDPAIGWLAETEMKSNMEMEVGTAAGAIAQKIEQTVTLKVTKQK